MIDRQIDRFCDTVGLTTLMKVVNEMKHPNYDMPIVEFNDRDIKHWMDNDEYYQLDDVDLFLLRHNREVQMFGHIRPVPLKLTPSDLLLSCNLYNWIESNLTVPKTNEVPKTWNFWIASEKGAEDYLTNARHLLTWTGGEPSETVLEAAEWFLHLQIAPVELLGGYYNIPNDVWMPLYSRAVMLQADMVEGLLSNLMQVVAGCQYTDIADGREVHPDVIRHYWTFKEEADPLKEKMQNDPYFLYGPVADGGDSRR